MVKYPHDKHGGLRFQFSKERSAIGRLTAALFLLRGRADFA